MGGLTVHAKNSLVCSGNTNSTSPARNTRNAAMYSSHRIGGINGATSVDADITWPLLGCGFPTRSMRRGRQGVLGQVCVKHRDHGGAVPDCRSHPFDRTGPHVADSE